MTKTDDKARNRERMLEFIRDTLISKASDLRSWHERPEQDFVRWRASGEAARELRQIVALEAAADVFIHLAGEWQAHETRPEWLITIAKQAMATFTLALDPQRVDSGDNGESPGDETIEA